MRSLTVVKVGGSLFDMPGLGPRLQRWLGRYCPDSTLVVPGGGRMVDVLRDFDRRHGLGEEQSHWLALRALALNSRVLAELVPGTPVVESATEVTVGLAVLDPLAFCLTDQRDCPSHALPHTWAVTSDSIAARVAAVAQADRLILLKSIDIPAAMTWAEAGRLRHVDSTFADLVASIPSLDVQAINFRTEGL
jgi:aspartokinase-like uncharacterized kinase